MDADKAKVGLAFVLCLVLGSLLAAGAAALPADKDAAVALKVILYLFSACVFLVAAVVAIWAAFFYMKGSESGPARVRNRVLAKVDPRYQAAVQSFLRLGSQIDASDEPAAASSSAANEPRETIVIDGIEYYTDNWELVAP